MIKIIEKNKTEVIDEFNSIINEILDILKLGEPLEHFGRKYIGIKKRKEDYNDLIDILLNVLEQNTDINNTLYKKKYSLNEFYVKDAIKGLDSYKNTPELYVKFLENLNQLFKSEISEFRFVIPLNIIFDLEYNKNDLDSVLESFGLIKLDLENLKNLINEKKEDISHSNNDEYTLPEDYIKKELINLNEASEILKNFSEIIYVDISARNMDYAYKKAIFYVESFLGYISFINLFLRYKEYFGEFEEFNFSELNYGTILFIKNGEIIRPLKNQAESVKDRIVRNNELIDEDVFSNLVNVCDDHIKKITSESLMNILKKSFSLYYSACSEKTLDYSFLKFWTLTEQMIKIKKKEDEEFLRILKSFVNPFLARRIDFLYRKRNRLVHKGEADKISYNDRNLSKILADILLESVLIKFKDLKNKNECDNYFINHPKA